VSAVSSVFIGASNELGEFESGVTAAWWGVVPAVVVGGIGAIAAAALFAYLFPQLRRIDTLTLEALRPQGHHEEAHVGKEQQAPGQTRSGAGPPA
jgi:hypothetical protein